MFKPIAPSASQITTSTHRITVLTDGLIRFESDPQGKFEDRASTFAINRDLPTPKYTIVKRGKIVEVLTDRFLLKWTGEDFSPSSVIVTLREAGEWRAIRADIRQYQHGMVAHLAVRPQQFQDDQSRWNMSYPGHGRWAV